MHFHLLKLNIYPFMTKEVVKRPVNVDQHTATADQSTLSTLTGFVACPGSCLSQVFVPQAASS